MKRFALIYLILVVFVGLVLSACSGDKVNGGESDSGTTNLVWGAASLGSNAQMIATAIANVIGGKESDIKISVQATGGSSENPRLISKEQVDIAHVTDAYKATKGVDIFEGEDPVELWSLFTMYSNELVFIVPEDSEIQSVEDLVGKKVSTGPPGAGVTQMSKAALEAYGVFDQIEVINLGYNEAVDALKDGVVDAIGNFSSLGIPSPSLEQLDQSFDYRILPMDTEILQKAFDQYPDYGPVVIPAGSFSEIEEDFQTLASFSIEFADSRMTDDVAYRIVKNIYENLEEVGSYHNLAKKMKLENALMGLPKEVPVHPGAAKYYKEKGIWNDSYLEGERK